MLPDENLIFEIEISNVGVGDESLFALYAQHTDNDGGLAIFVDGALLDGSKVFSNVKKIQLIIGLL